MKLTDKDVNYDALLDTSEELCRVVALAVGTDYTELAKKALNVTDSIITLQFAIFDHSDDYAPELRWIAAMCLWLLIDQEERRKNDNR